MSHRPLWRVLGPLALVIGLLPGSPPAGSQAPPTSAIGAQWQVGQGLDHHLEVLGRQVPLPGQGWQVAAVGVDPMERPPSRAYGVIFTLVLLRLSGPQVDAFALIHANAVPDQGGWGLSRDCRRAGLPLTKVYEDDEQHAFCAFIRPLETPADPGAAALPAWRDALALAARRGWQVPVAWREVGFRIGDWYDVLDVRYGVPRPDGALQVTPLPAADPQDADLTAWLQDMQPLIYLGFKHALAGRTVPNLPTTARPTPRGGPAAPPASHEMSNSRLGLLKVITSRVINMTTSVGIDYLFVGSMYVAASLQFVSSAFHGGVDYVEELLWNTYGPQRLHHAGTYDFTYVGGD
jgi:uncharacterized membrane protein